MTEHYLDRLARTITENWDSSALTDFYLTEGGSAQDTSRGNRYTYGEMYQEILRLCELFHVLGLKQGDHIAICGANSAHWAIAYLAIAAYQGVAVTILHSQSPEDIAHQIDFSDAKALFTNEDLWKELQSQSLPQIEHVISLENWQVLRGKKISNLQSPISNRDCQFIHGNPDELAMICFTSGSTGVSKGVMLSFASISNNATYKLEVFSKYAGTNVLALLPFAHIYGLVIELLLPLCAGANTNIIMKEFSPLNIIYSSIILNPKIIFVVPIILEYFRKNDVDIQTAWRDLDFLSVGGSHLDLSLEKYLESKNVRIAIGYGATECGTRVTLATCNEYKSQSVGKIVNGLSVRIAPNGEILVKGENVMLGYYKDPEATARKIDKDGWLHTGDKGHLDEDGYLYVEGRLEQDIIVLPNGENIRPDNIEALINALPEVSESIVLARDGKLVAIVSAISNQPSVISKNELRRTILRTINPELPLYSQLYDVEITDVPLQKTEKQTIKRYLYK